MRKSRLRRHIEDLLGGGHPRPFPADDFEADQIRTAIDLRAAAADADTPREEFLSELHRRLAAQTDPPSTAEVPRRRFDATRRQVIVGSSAAAASAVAAVAIDRTLAGRTPAEPPQADETLEPNNGQWRAVAASAEVTDAGMTRFEQDSLIGFVHRVDGRLEAVSGVCTHQGCKLWFDNGADRLRCPCHTTSFAPDGALLTHQLPIAPAPLPKLQVREVDGVVQVLGPPEPPRPA